MSQLIFIVQDFSLTFFLFTDFANAEKEPQLEIYPVQKVQRKPVGKPLILTCKANVPDPDLVTDLKWTGQDDIPIRPRL